MSAAKIILQKCLGLKAGEKCLILADEGKKDIAESIFAEASKITKSDIVIMPIADHNGQEPPSDIAAKMMDYDVIVAMTTRSLSHTNARKDAVDNGARLASMPGITQDIINRAIDVDYDSMIERTKYIADKLDIGSSVRIVTTAGTDITLSISGRRGKGYNSGIFDSPGKWGNLPEGEAFIAPVEGTANGVYVVDGSQAGIEKLTSPLKITVKDGYAISFEGDQSDEFRSILEAIKDKDAFNIAELGIGTNNKAILTGIILEDEKVSGTCHIALGNNFGFGGNVDVPVHVDGVMLEPDIYIDEVLIMKKGILQR